MFGDTRKIADQIGKTVLAHLPAAWRSATVTLVMIEGHSEETANYLPGDGSEQTYFDPGREVSSLFEELRLAMYESAPGCGAWYVAKLSLTAEGHATFKFDYDDRSQFTVQPDADDFAEDLLRFPRSELGSKDDDDEPDLEGP